MNIRKMTRKDLSFLPPLAEQLGYKCSLEEVFSRFELLAEDDGVGLFIGEIEGSIIAFMQIHQNSTLLTGQRAELDAVVIDEHFRGQGFGKKMMAAAEDWARSKELPKLRLGSKTSRTDTHEFYKQYGFTVEKTWFVFSKPVR